MCKQINKLYHTMRTKKRIVLYVLCLGILVFCLNNIYQSYEKIDTNYQHDGDVYEDPDHRMDVKDVDFVEELMKAKGMPTSNKNVGTNFKNQIADIAIGSVCPPGDSELVYKYINGTKRVVPKWQLKLERCGYLGEKNDDIWKVFLTEVIQVRVYKEDKARWTIRELKQWMHYMFLAGVEHIFICDHFKFEYEQLDIPLERYIDLGLVTYIAWGKTRDPIKAQKSCYQHVIDTYKHHTKWQMTVDMDEYPFAPQDTEQGFLTRHLQNITLRQGDGLSEIYLENYLMLGQGDRKRDIVIDRINRMTPEPANRLGKPIYIAERVSRAAVRDNGLKYGTRLKADAKELHTLHYWGARGQNWGPDTPHTLNITREMNLMREHWPEQLRNSLLVFGEFDAFTNITGP